MNWNRFNQKREWWETIDWGPIYHFFLWVCLVLCWTLLITYVAKVGIK